MTLPQSVRDDAAAVEAHLQTMFADMTGPADRLAAAMRYATMNGGKRLRACLVMAAGRLAAGGKAQDGLIEVAEAVGVARAWYRPAGRRHERVQGRVLRVFQKNENALCRVSLCAIPGNPAPARV